MLWWLLAGMAAFAGGDEYARGMEAARAQRWEEARGAFLAGEREHPRDKRYPLELAGLAWREGRAAEAKRYLGRALALDPGDTYGNDFLASIYFLGKNTEAALKYWNRAGKPVIFGIGLPQDSLLAPVWIDTLRISPGQVLTLDEYRGALARIQSLDVFSRIAIRLVPEASERFDLEVQTTPREGWRSAAAAVRALPFQTLNLDFRNLNGAGLNWTNLVRWDAQKRRVSSTLATPFGTDLRWRIGAFADARSETWNTGSPEDFRMNRIEGGVDIGSATGGPVAFTNGVRIASRSFRNAPGFSSGLSAKYRAGVEARLFEWPEHRLTIHSQTWWELGRMFAGGGAAYSRASASADARWLPGAGAYRLGLRLSGGGSSSATPFDELFILGLERDNDLPLRAHIGTRDGKKGSAPIGRNYFLANWDFDRDLYNAGFIALSAGPFADVGRIASKTPVDVGVQVTVRVLATVSIVLSYGRDLRGGRNAFYARSE